MKKKGKEKKKKKKELLFGRGRKMVKEKKERKGFSPLTNRDPASFTSYEVYIYLHTHATDIK